MAHPLGTEQDRLALLRAQRAQGRRTQETDRKPAARRAAQAKQRRGGHVPVQLPHTQRQDQIPRARQAPHARLQPMPVDEHAQDHDFPIQNISKSYFGSEIGIFSHF